VFSPRGFTDEDDDSLVAGHFGVLFGVLWQFGRVCRGWKLLRGQGDRAELQDLPIVRRQRRLATSSTTGTVMGLSGRLRGLFI
jgi:hypothetical protein